jgi:hypothetical protein
MKIELISFRYNIKEKKRLDLMINLVNQSQADLIMFCGSTLYYQKDLGVLKERIDNKNSFVLFEVREVKDSKFIDLKNCLYSIENGVIHNLFTNQFFSTKDEIEGNGDLCERFINELETRRCFKIKGKTCLVLQCGENNILRNIQKEANRPVFRLQERIDLKERFDCLLNKTHIILNPIHTPMGNQGKMERRREYFSANNRYYFSVSQNGTTKRNDSYYEILMDSDRLQYAYHNGKAIEEYSSNNTKDFQIRVFDL